MIAKIFLILVVSLSPSYLFSNNHYKDTVIVEKTVNELLEDGYEIYQINTIETDRVVNVIHLIKKNSYITCYVTSLTSKCKQSREKKLF